MTHHGLTGSILSGRRNEELWPQIADPVAKSSWLRFRCVNHVFAFTCRGVIQTDSPLNTISVICSVGTFLASPPMLLNGAMTDSQCDTLRECLIRSKAICEQKKLTMHFER